MRYARRGLPRANVEFIRAGATHTVENCEQMEFLGVRLRLGQPPIREEGEFLRAIGFAAIQGQAPGRRPHNAGRDSNRK